MPDTATLTPGEEPLEIEKEVIDRAILKASETPIGTVIDFIKCFGLEEEN